MEFYYLSYHSIGDSMIAVVHFPHSCPFLALLTYHIKGIQKVHLCTSRLCFHYLC